MSFKFLPLTMQVATLGILVVTSNRSYAQAKYQFVKIADTETLGPNGTPFTQFTDVAMSDGTVAFTAAYGNGVGVFTGSGGPLTVVAKTGDASDIGAFTEFGQPSFDSGTVAFTGFSSQNSGVFASTGGVMTTIAKSGDVTPHGILRAVGSERRHPINAAAGLVANSGTTVSFHAEVGSPTSRDAIFVGNGGALTTIVKEGDPGPTGPLDSFGAQSMRGDVVMFTAESGGSDGIYKGSGGALTTLLKRGDPAPQGTFHVLSNVASIGDGIAFYAEYSAPQFNYQFAITTFDGSTTLPIYRANETLPNSFDSISFLHTVAASISGNNVAFSAQISPTEGSPLLISRDGGPVEYVIRNRSSLFNHRLLHAYTSRFSFDPSGSGVIAFAYTLVRAGTLEPAGEGIAVAIPAPEPSSSLLLFIASGGALGLRRRQRIAT